MERFKTCLFNDDYLIGDNGTVKSTIPRTLARVKSGILKGLIKKDGYKMYWLDKKWYYAHRLVAMHFNRNFHKWVEVNHIDGVKLNNNYKNLEWTTRKLNQMHMRYYLGKKSATGVDSPSYGRVATDHTKKLMSEAKKGIKHPKFKGYYIFNGIEYIKLRELATANGIGIKRARDYCNANLYGYSFKPILLP